MDDFDLDPAEIEHIFRDLDRVNELLGGTTITIDGLKKLLRKIPLEQPIVILDIGCGNGSMLRTIAELGRKQQWNMKLIGIDANPEAISLAQKQSISYPSIEYHCLNVQSSDFAQLSADIILCTLTLHHFNDQEIIKLVNSFMTKARVGVVINDLQRSKLAFHLFKAFSAVFMRNKIAKQDGLLSIKRSFSTEDFDRYIAQLQEGEHEIRWKWAFRYQWLIYSANNTIKSENGYGRENNRSK